MKILILALQALRPGSMLANPGIWKNRAAAIMALTMLIGILLKIAKVRGYDIPLSDEDIASIAGFIVTAVGMYFNYATSEKVGLGKAVTTDPVHDTAQRELDLGVQTDAGNAPATDYSINGGGDPNTGGGA